MPLTDRCSDVSYKRIIAVGRLDYQKGFDRLIQAWELVQQTNKYGGWRLDIFGQGEWHDMLQRMIDRAGLQETVHINRPTTSIGDEYAHSSMLVMSSHYEGFPMVMIEAMVCGLPVVSFDYKCGPGDIIEDGVNGLLVTDGDIEGLAAAMTRLMSDGAYRRELSANARKVTDTYSEEAVMARWLNLFTSLTEK
ncbi:glycosyltransferase [Bacteroides fragilis]